MRFMYFYAANNEKSIDKWLKIGYKYVQCIKDPKTHRKLHKKYTKGGIINEQE